MKNVLTVFGIMIILCFFSQNAKAQNLIKTEGSDSLVIVAHAWAEAYRKIRPDIAVAVTGGGSGTGIAALINGFADIANASRKMTDKETELAKGHGYDPQEFIVGFDALAIFLHPNNPISSLSITNWQKSSAKQERLLNGANLILMFPDVRSRR